MNSGNLIYQFERILLIDTLSDGFVVLAIILITSLCYSFAVPQITIGGGISRTSL